MTRRERFYKDGEPKYIRCYDNGGESADRYTVVFTYASRFAGKLFINRTLYVAMSENPYHPQGVGIHGESEGRIDYPSYTHLGKKIKFVDLPEKCKQLVVSDYNEYWRLNNERVN